MRRIACLLLALALLTGCGVGPGTPADAADAAPPDSFTDSLGRTVTLNAPPQRVAVLFSSYAEVWTAAGGRVDITVGESVARGFAAADAVLVDPGAGHTTLDLETLVAAEPDLVIGTADYACQVEAASFCTEAGIPAAVFRVECVDDYLALLKLCCGLTGQPDRYAVYGTAVAERIDALLARVDALDGSAPDVLLVRAGASARSTKAKTSDDSFVGGMLERLGAVNIADRADELTVELSLERILEADPDYLLITTMGDETAAREYMDTLLTTEGWRELSCVAAGRYCYLPKELFHYKPNVRWAEAYAYLAEILYPELKE